MATREKELGELERITDMSLIYREAGALAWEEGLWYW